MTTGYQDITVTEATRIQRELREKIKLDPLDKDVSLIGGADISFNRFSPVVYAGIVLLTFPEMVPVARSLVKAEVRFPYVPGYLAFREVPALLQAWNQLPLKPDVLVVDGHGIAHPRRMGIASHFGVLTGQPTIGCAKKPLFGHFAEPGPHPNEVTPLLDNNRESIGWVLRTKHKVKPVFISPGHGLGLEDSLRIITSCMGRYRLPEPTRMAHLQVNLFRTGHLQEGYSQVTPV